MPGFNQAYIDLYAVPRMTETRLKHLLQHFGEPQAILEARADELLQVENIDAELARAVLEYRRSDETGQKIGLALELGVWTTSWLEPDYPANLKQLVHMPPVLFGRGELTEDDRLAVAVVGTRRPSPYGKMVSERLAAELARHGVTVVSGLARGIDTFAHRSAIQAGGRTIGVLGCGIDVTYPPENRGLYEEVVTCGAIISEFTLGMEPMAMNFPKRNRIVSGLAKAVVAVEAGDKSGVLNTAAWAADQGRDVYAVPGRVTEERSAGTNRLLREGARPVTSAQDILADLGVALHLEERAKVDVTDQEKPALELLSGDPLHVDEICQELGVPVAALLSTLMQLEMKGLVRQLPGKLFVRQY
ncbi:MAG: DNA-processing protein DprA [candidate division WOR-3 bacterium]|nr:MAG: DNA-processing protein DprA [candidate division WOR-3 bacterium]